MRKLPALILSAAAILTGVPCLAATPVSAAKTKEYHDAYAAFNANDIVKAFEILAPLVQRTHAYDATGFLGQTELSLNMYRDAAEHLSFAIQNTPPGKAEDSLPILKQDLTEAKRHITTLHITVDQPGADIAIDGKVIGKSPLDTDIFVDAGKHTVKATHPDLGSAESAFDAKLGEEKTLALQLAPTPVDNPNTASPPPLKYTPADLDRPSSPPAPVNTPPPVEPKHGVEPKTIVLIAGGAVTLIAAGTATYFGVKAHSASNDAETLLGQAEKDFGQNPCLNPSGANAAVCSNIRNKLDSHDSASRVFNVALPISIGAAAATGLLYLVWPRNHTSTASAFAITPTGDAQSRGILLRASF